MTQCGEHFSVVLQRRETLHKISLISALGHLALIFSASQEGIGCPGDWPRDMSHSHLHTVHVMLPALKETNLVFILKNLFLGNQC